MIQNITLNVTDFMSYGQQYVTAQNCIDYTESLRHEQKTILIFVIIMSIYCLLLIINNIKLKKRVNDLISIKK